MIESLILRFELETRNCNIGLQIDKLDEGFIRFQQTNNNHAANYKTTILEPRWLELVVDSDKAEIINIGSNTYYKGFSSDVHDSVYLLELLDYKIFLSWKSHFLWLTTDEKISELDLATHLFQWRNLCRDGGDSHYTRRHETMMECLHYLKLV